MTENSLNLFVTCLSPRDKQSQAGQSCLLIWSCSCRSMDGSGLESLEGPGRTNSMKPKLLYVQRIFGHHCTPEWHLWSLHCLSTFWNQKLHRLGSHSIGAILFRDCPFWITFSKMRPTFSWRWEKQHLFWGALPLKPSLTGQLFNRESWRGKILKRLVQLQLALHWCQIGESVGCKIHLSTSYPWTHIYFFNAYLFQGVWGIK